MSIPLSQRVSCSRCHHTYEVGGITNRTGEPLPWLVVVADVASEDEAFKQATCQVCHGFEDGPSLRSVLESLDVEITPAIPIVRSSILTAAPKAPRQQRQVVGVQPKGSDSGQRLQVVEATPRVRQQRQVVGVPTPHQQRQVVGVIEPPRQHRPRRDKPARANLGADLLAKIETAASSGDKRLEGYLKLAHLAGLKHPLVTAYGEKVAAEEAAKAASDARKARALFGLAISWAKRYLVIARQRSGSEDVTDWVDKLNAKIKLARKLDTKSRTHVALLEMIGTSRDELRALIVEFFLTVTATSGGGSGGSGGFEPRRERGSANTGAAVKSEAGTIELDTRSVTGYVDSIKCHKGTGSIAVIRRSASSPYPEANTPVPEVVTGAILEADQAVPRIAYPKDQKYGPHPYLVLSTGDHQFKLEEGDGQVGVMGQGMTALMLRGKDGIWLYKPVLSDPHRIIEHLLVGRSDRGFVDASLALAEPQQLLVFGSNPVFTDPEVQIQDQFLIMTEGRGIVLLHDGTDLVHRDYDNLAVTDEAMLTSDWTMRVHRHQHIGDRSTTESPVTSVAPTTSV